MGRKPRADCIDRGGQIVAGIEPVGQSKQHVHNRRLVSSPASAEPRAQRQPGPGQLGHPSRQLGRLFGRELSRYVETGPGKACHETLFCGAAVPAARAGGTPAPQGILGYQLSFHRASEFNIIVYGMNNTKA